MSRKTVIVAALMSLALPFAAMAQGTESAPADSAVQKADSAVQKTESSTTKTVKSVKKGTKKAVKKASPRRARSVRHSTTVKSSSMNR